MDCFWLMELYCNFFSDALIVREIQNWELERLWEVLKGINGVGEFLYFSGVFGVFIKTNSL